MTVDAEQIFAGLNPEQRRAAEAVRGPVCILAGAGSGKTTTVTRRIAWQVASGAFQPSEILAVTFTDKAAGELKSRLAGLGVNGVVARTFHAAALAQLRGLSDDAPGRVISSKVPLLIEIMKGLHKAFRFRSAMDVASEIEWAKARRISADRYEAAVGERQTPLPVDLMARVYARYEALKREQGLVDFDDMLELAVRMFEQDEAVAERFRDRYRAFTIDEYQDVNELQQALVDRWLGPRDDLCVVGDDYQAIYSFTGASADHLLAMPGRFARAVVVNLEQNYRSTPEILELANRLAPYLGGVHKQLRAVAGPGPEPVIKRLPGRLEQSRFAVEQLRRVHADGVPWEETAILYRTNQRSEDYEEALVAAGIPYQVRGGAFLDRPAARRLLRTLRDPSRLAVAAAVREAALSDGLLEELPPGLGEQEETRQDDLARLVRLAEEFDQNGTRTVGEFVDDLDRRFRSDGDGRGVHLLTLHRAKGLEFDAVLLPLLEEGELPYGRKGRLAPIDEERRLLYVGLTRAKRELVLTWETARQSRFLGELGLERWPAPAPEKGASRPQAAPREQVDLAALETPLGEALRRWRSARARHDKVPAYVVFGDRTLLELVERRPATLGALSGISGIGPAKLERYGDELLGLLAGSVSTPA